MDIVVWRVVKVGPEKKAIAGSVSQVQRERERERVCVCVWGGAVREGMVQDGQNQV
jgi:hypothetical protein